MGSSPLARGLQHSRSAPRMPLGIIPARAGFTRDDILLLYSVRDHPRSRGVYMNLPNRVCATSGSSPLARGLPVDTIIALNSYRIIPARAGFTRVPHRELTSMGDHPRSRGVYGVAALPPLLTVGSSPLARGLRVRIRVGINSDGIIPARAGFTFAYSSSVDIMKDHPRSRGVYPAWPEP